MDRKFRCEVVIFPPRSSPSRIAAEQRRLLAEFEGSEAESSALRTGGGIDWLLSQTDDPVRTAATALWIEGRPSGGGISDRIRQARSSLLGSPFAPVLVVVTPERVERGGTASRDQRALLQAFFDSQPNFAAQIVDIIASAARSEAEPK